MQINFTINIDDKLSERIKRLFTRRNTIAVIFMSIFAISAMVYAASVTKPWVFKNGDLIDADKINDNFDALYQAVNSPTFGAWEEKSLAWEYHAETDGFIFGTVNTSNSSGSSVNMDLFRLFVSDINSINTSGDPTFKSKVTIAAGAYAGVPFSIPVNKGKYWILTSDVAAADIKMYWCPVGN